MDMAPVNLRGHFIFAKGKGIFARIGIKQHEDDVHYIAHTCTETDSQTAVRPEVGCFCLESFCAEFGLSDCREEVEYKANRQKGPNPCQRTETICGEESLRAYSIRGSRGSLGLDHKPEIHASCASSQEAFSYMMNVPTDCRFR